MMRVPQAVVVWAASIASSSAVSTATRPKDRRSLSNKPGPLEPEVGIKDGAQSLRFKCVDYNYRVSRPRSHDQVMCKGAYFTP